MKTVCVSILYSLSGLAPPLSSKKKLYSLCRFYTQFEKEKIEVSRDVTKSRRLL